MLHTEGVAIDHQLPAVFGYRPPAQAPAVIQRFHDPVLLLIDGCEQTAPAGACLVTLANEAVGHRGAGHAFRTDWLLVTGPLAEVAAQVGCPLGEVIAGCTAEAWRDVVDGLARECWRREQDWRVVVDQRLRELLIILARAGRVERPADEVVAGVRRRIMREPERPWTVADMATFANVSQQRFAARYRSAFGVSPLEDLLRERIRLARHLLTHTGLPVAEAARRSGFRDLPWFHRCFKQRLGLTPLQARHR